MRKSIFSVAYSALTATGLTHLLRATRPGAVILCYHNVTLQTHPTADPGLHLPAPNFEQQMGWLSRATTVVPLSEIFSRVSAGKPLRGLSAVTFDDAYQGTIRNALPILETLGLPNTVFVASRHTDSSLPFWWDHPSVVPYANDHRDDLLIDLKGDRELIYERLKAAEPADVHPELLPATWEMLRGAPKLTEFGAHSVTHRNLTALAPAELEKEIVGSRDDIEKNLGVRPTKFAYPYGLVNQEVAEAVKDAGLQAGFSLTGQDARPGDNPYLIPRLNIPSGISLPAFKAWCSGLAHIRATRSR